MKVLKLDRPVTLAELANALLGARAGEKECSCSRSGKTPVPVRAVFGLAKGEPAGENAEGEGAARRNDPVLTTKVWFSDGSWTQVKNAPEDPVDTVEAKASDGSEVETATDASKERALVFAMAKRLFGKVDPKTREVTCPDFAGRFRKVLKASTDRNLEKAEKEIRRRAEKAKAEREASKEYVTKADLDDFAKTLASQIAEAFAKKAGEGPAKGPEGA